MMNAEENGIGRRPKREGTEDNGLRRIGIGRRGGRGKGVEKMPNGF
jgi:hypothetical protein